MNTQLEQSVGSVNQEIANLPTSTEVRYTISVSKDYNFEKDVLQSKSVSVTLNLTANTLDLDELNLPWGIRNIPWIIARGFKFQSVDVQPNFGANVRSFTSWTETYIITDISETEQDIFDVQENVEMPTWNLQFFMYNNPNLGSSSPDLPVDKRMRQVFGLRPIQGSITARSFEQFSHDPYDFINKTFGTFEGIINQARLTESLEDGVKIYDLSIGWIGGNVGGADVPTYTI